MGNSGDIRLASSWYTLNGGVDVTAQKYLMVPNSAGRGFYYFGYKVDRVSGEMSYGNNEVSLLRHYWVD